MVVINRGGCGNQHEECKTDLNPCYKWNLHVKIRYSYNIEKIKVIFKTENLLSASYNSSRP